MRLPRRDERGTGTIVMVAVLVVLTVVAAAVAVATGYVVTAHRARTAADLAAVSGANARYDGGDACAAARASARENGAAVLACEVVGDQLDFVVAVTTAVMVPRSVPGLPKRLAAPAHAGLLQP